MGALSPEDRPKVGQMVNEVRAELESMLNNKNNELKAIELAARLKAEKIDVTLPGRINQVGHLHPLTLTLNRIKSIFMQMGFSVAEGPEVNKIILTLKR